MNAMTEQTLTEPIDERQAPSRSFSRYQTILVALLALVQFTIIIDFMIMSPLGAIMMPALDISAAQFGVAVSAYAFSAGISGILAAGLPIDSIASGCSCFSMPASPLERRFARSLPIIMCCCSAGS